MNKIPKSFVMRSGIVGSSVTALVRDVRRVLEPNTASHLRVKYTHIHTHTNTFILMIIV